jgi:hypothetical protein
MCVGHAMNEYSGHAPLLARVADRVKSAESAESAVKENQLNPPLTGIDV